MKRPVLVTIIGVLMVLQGLGQVAVGALVLAKRNDATFLDDANITSGKATGLAIGLLVVGALLLLLAIGLFKGSRASRDVIGLLEVGAIAVGVYTIVSLDSSHRATGIGSIVGAVIVLYFLFGTDKAKHFFAKA